MRPFDFMGFLWLAGACATVMLGLEWLVEAQSQRLALAVLMLVVGACWHS